MFDIVLELSSRKRLNLKIFAFSYYFSLKKRSILEHSFQAAKWLRHLWMMKNENVINLDKTNTCFKRKGILYWSDIDE